MESRNKYSPSGLILKGWDIALPVSLKGSVVFTIVRFIAYVIPQIFQVGNLVGEVSGGGIFNSLLIIFTSLIYTLTFFFVPLIFNVFLAFVLAGFAGVGIAAIVFYGLKKGFMTAQKSFFIGISVGSLVTLVCCFLLTYPARIISSLSPTNSPSAPTFAFDATLAVLIAAVCGGQSAISIYHNLLQKI
jgi:hypothetical protein